MNIFLCFTICFVKGAEGFTSSIIPVSPIMILSNPEISLLLFIPGPKVTGVLLFLKTSQIAETIRTAAAVYFIVLYKFTIFECNFN